MKNKKIETINISLDIPAEALKDGKWYQINYLFERVKGKNIVRLSQIEILNAEPPSNMPICMSPDNFWKGTNEKN